MCEMKIIGQATVAKYIKFTSVGIRVCKKVCQKCIASIKDRNKLKDLKVKLLERYCEMIDKERSSNSMTNLATQCVCVYHVQKDSSWRTVIVYKLHANPEGLIKIESN